MGNSISKFIDGYIESGMSRFHMPGHKGKLPWLSGKRDITEISGADSLYRAAGIIREAEEAAARYYGSGVTAFSAGGSTLAIQAMVMLLRRRGIKKILAGRAAHAAFVSVCGIIGVDPVWIGQETDKEFGTALPVMEEDVRAALDGDIGIGAVYLTCPDYFGRLCDYRAIARICREREIPLVLDNAHGAHLKGSGFHPLEQGADLCCDSAHKTLPALTGGAFLHARKGFAQREEIKSAMEAFGSTSPSYLIMESLACAVDYIKTSGEEFLRLKERVGKIRALAKGRGLSSLDGDITKLSFDCFSAGFTGEELATHLRKHRIEPEYVSRRHMVLLCTPQNSERDFDRLETAVSSLKPKEPIKDTQPPLPKWEKVCPPGESMLAVREWVDADSSVGRIAAETVFACPPGTMILCAGERVLKDHIHFLKRSGILAVAVVK